MKKQFTILACFIIAALIVFPRSVAAGGVLSKSLQAVSAKDTVCNVWVFFSDRPDHGDVGRVSELAALRRQRAGFKGGEGERPVSVSYIRQVERRGGVLRNTFAWENAASFSVHSSKFAEISALPFVKSVTPVAVYVRKGDGGRAGKSAAQSSAGSGYEWHTEMLNIPLAHEYLKAKRLGNPGNGVLMAFFDSGFRTDHKAFARLRDSGSVISTRDYVDARDTLVHNPDSIVKNIRHKYYESDRHGTQTLGLVAGYDPGVYIGVAWDARFMLARTEDVAIEARVEEDNWAAAVVWAESLGVNIISSSLGYRDGFDNPAEDYEYKDMDGATTIISRAAAGAVARGVIVVNSAGNERNHIDGTITAPADVDGVVAVGAVDRNRVLAPFSSSGPTYDGRIKPDIVAPGSSVPVVRPYTLSGLSTVSYEALNGTSFSAPIVGGILALILQSNPGISPEEAKERLYRSCSFAARQTFVDNKTGHGVPDALRAVMGDDEIFVKIVDSVGLPLIGARVVSDDTVYLISNPQNYILDNLRHSPLPRRFTIFFRDEEVGKFTVDTLPFTDVIAVNVKRDGGLVLYPNVVKRNSVVKGKYYFSGFDASAPAVVTVRTLNGRKIWEEKLRVRPDGTAEFAWNRRDGRNIAAGLYLMTVRHGYNMISEKMLVTE